MLKLGIIIEKYLTFNLDNFICYFGSGGGGATSLTIPANVGVEIENWINNNETPSSPLVIATGVIPSTVRLALGTTIADNPYDTLFDSSKNAILTNPSSKIASIVADADSIKNLLTPAANLTQELDDSNTRWDTMADVAIEYVDGNDVFVVSQTEIDNLVDEFETEILREHRREINREAASAVNNNAVNSSSYIIGAAVLGDGKNQQVRRKRRELELQFENLRQQHRAAFIQNNIQNMTNSLYTKQDIYSKVVQLAMESNRINIVGTKEFEEGFNELVLADRSWALDNYQEAANVIASMQGGVASGNVRPLSRTQSAIGGSIAGAQLGAQISGGNPIATGVGAAIGLISGLFN